MVYTIAEIGTAWRGDLHSLRKLTEDCKEAGFNAVKLQAFKKEHLNSRYWRLISSVNEFNVETIAEMMHDIGIKWGCTVIYPEAAEFLKGHIDFWKIRHKDHDKEDIINAVVNARSINEQAIVSVSKSSDFNINSFHKLYCIPKYPHYVHEIDWNEMQNCKGWSCHCPSFHAIQSAIVNEIQLLEVHVVPHHSPDFVDNPVSFSTDEFRHLFEVIENK